MLAVGTPAPPNPHLGPEASEDELEAGSVLSPLQLVPCEGGREGLVATAADQAALGKKP